ncbi:class I SAM-dependent methyltransferase [Gorillibacterium sp. sgz5001074]|uniref:class I SAM-dependent methyltransferase n=1 Tax=Gorillibacterium sp. sgz5001074 TaxID=3446695 RepID=UPI003F6815F5
MEQWSPERLKEAYNRHATERERMEKQEWKQIERERFLQRMKDEGKRKLLEIGPGPGHDSLYFRDHGLEVRAADASEEMVRLCREKGLDADVMDMEALAYEDGSFDGVYAQNCLLHIPKRLIPQVLQEIRRVLKTGGLFFWGVYGGEDSEGIWDKDAYEPKRFFSFYTDEGLQAAAAPFFEQVDFHTVHLGEDALSFQSLTLRKGE